jgi:hypothetical protein
MQCNSILNKPVFIKELDYAVESLVEALRYNPEGDGFDSR